MNDVPDTFNALRIHGGIYYIDDVTRTEIETFLKTDPGKVDFITIDTLCGEELMVIGYNVSSIHSTSPEIRDRDRQFQKMFRDEDPAGDD